jgi:hypothetical protein
MFAFPNIDVTPQKANNNSISKYELGKRYLKLGNTYREAKDYDNAFRYIQKGQDVFNKQNNSEERYWYAVSQEYLGYYYRDLNLLHNANRLLSDAEQIFSDVLTQADGSQIAISNKKIRMKKGLEKNFINDNIRKIKEEKPFIVNLDNRNLTDLPGNFNANKVDNLSIANNQLTRLPERINSFNTLRLLNVAHNQISVFPYMNNLKKLRHLDFSNNQLTEIGASIGDLRSLQYLNLSNNPNLVYISNEIFKLNNLEVLDISNTALPRYLIDDLIANLPNTNVIYTITPAAAPANNNINIDDNENWEDEEDEDWENF